MDRSSFHWIFWIFFLEHHSWTLASTIREFCATFFAVVIVNFPLNSFFVFIVSLMFKWFLKNLFVIEIKSLMGGYSTEIFFFYLLLSFLGFSSGFLLFGKNTFGSFGIFCVEVVGLVGCCNLFLFSLFICHYSTVFSARFIVIFVISYENIFFELLLCCAIFFLLIWNNVTWKAIERQSESVAQGNIDFGENFLSIFSALSDSLTFKLFS